MERKKLIKELLTAVEKLNFFIFPVFIFGEFYYEIKFERCKGKSVYKTRIKGSEASEILNDIELQKLVSDLKEITVTTKDKKPITCVKVRFNNFDEANAELRRILETTHFKPWKDKKPSRVYECEKCKGWHLTSKIFHYPKINN